MKLPSEGLRHSAVHRLRRHQFLSLRKPRGLCVRTERGSLWVTVDGEPEDIELSAGESRVFEGLATVVVGTLGGDAVFSTTPPKALFWARRLQAWLRAWANPAPCRVPV